MFCGNFGGKEKFRTVNLQEKAVDKSIGFTGKAMNMTENVSLEEVAANY